jgi:hypothetical protein
MTKQIRAPSEEDLDKAEKEMTKDGIDNTICQILRDIYALSKDYAIQRKCIEATVYAKRMDSALRKKDVFYDAGWWGERE